MPSPVAIIDIGSNSIKLLIAARGARGLPETVFSRTLDTRISAGISQIPPQLGEAGMAAGVAAIRELVGDAVRLGARSTVLVATSAVRDAANGREFRDRVRQATGCTIRILSGIEEANLIGRGLACDPSLAGLRNFYVFDLGGGSLEGLVFRDRRAVQETSLPLGCVRLTERCVADPTKPFGPLEGKAVFRAVKTAFGASGFAFSLASGAAVVGTGGTLTTARAVLAARAGQAMELADPLLPCDRLRDLLGGLGALPLAQRTQVPGLPPARADVFPTALATLLAVAEIGDFSAYRHSLYNLRWGLAAEELARG